MQPQHAPNFVSIVNIKKTKTDKYCAKAKQPNTSSLLVPSLLRFRPIEWPVFFRSKKLFWVWFCVPTKHNQFLLRRWSVTGVLYVWVAIGGGRGGGREAVYLPFIWPDSLWRCRIDNSTNVLASVSIQPLVFTWDVIFLLSALFYAVIFGNLTAIIQRLYSRTARYHQDVRIVNECIALHKIPESLQKTLRDFFTTEQAATRGDDIESVSHNTQ